MKEKFKNSWLGKWLRKKDNRNFVYLVLIVVSLWVSAWKLIVWLIPPEEGGMGRGVFGDMFGSINSLFSGLALAGIIYTVYLQKKELRLQRNELKLTRDEFKIQNDTLKTQKFENSFFNLVRNHQELLDILPGQRVGTKEEPRVRYAALKEIKERFKQNFEYMQKALETKEINGNYYLEYGSLKKLKSTIEEYRPLANDTLLTLEFIEKSEILDKEMYYKILKNSMSFSESILFGFFIEIFVDKVKLSDHVKEKFQHDYFTYFKTPIRKSTVLPPLVLPFQYYTEERSMVNNNPKNPLLKNQIMEWAKIVSFGFKNFDNQSISIAGVTIVNENGILADIDFKDDNKIGPNEAFNFSPLLFENLGLTAFAIGERSNVALLFLLRINCSVSGYYNIRYSLDILEAHDKNQVRISEFVRFENNNG